MPSRSTRTSGARRAQRPAASRLGFLTVGQTARILGVSASTLRLWESVGLVAPVRSNGKYRLYSPELLKATLLRARFMELLGGRSRLDGGPLFLVGLFSNMDALLQLPLAQLLRRVKVSSEVEGALLREETSAYFGVPSPAASYA